MARNARSVVTRSGAGSGTRARGRDARSRTRRRAGEQRHHAGREQGRLAEPDRERRRRRVGPGRSLADGAPGATAASVVDVEALDVDGVLDAARVLGRRDGRRGRRRRAAARVDGGPGGGGSAGAAFGSAGRHRGGRRRHATGAAARAAAGDGAGGFGAGVPAAGRSISSPGIDQVRVLDDVGVGGDHRADVRGDARRHRGRARRPPGDRGRGPTTCRLRRPDRRRRGHGRGALAAGAGSSTGPRQPFGRHGAGWQQQRPPGMERAGRRQPGAARLRAGPG